MDGDLGQIYTTVNARIHDSCLFTFHASVEH